jgi:CheY-like chemotaxis protein
VTLLRELSQLFTKRSAQMLEETRAAIAAGDAGTLGRTAHTFIGSLGVLGADEGVRCARELERRAQLKAFDESREIVNKLKMKWIPFNSDWRQFTEQPPAARAATLAKEKEPPAESGCKVVVAEDDPVSREVVCSLLRNWGYEVLVTRDGNEALEALRAQHAPTLAVLDWMMPGLDGVEVCRLVRALDKLVYILLLTARTGKEQWVEGLQAGADDYLTKPFNKEELRARLKSGLRVLTLQATLAARGGGIRKALAENHTLKLQLPL